VEVEAISEEEKMRRIPGIEFVDSPYGRCARIAGSSLDVWAFVKEYRVCGNDRTSFNQTFGALTQDQLNAALKYYFAFQEEIEEILDREADLSA
jgi:uncharacterized protein (DUF433 family)